MNPITTCSLLFAVAILIATPPPPKHRIAATGVSPWRETFKRLSEAPPAGIALVVAVGVFLTNQLISIPVSLVIACLIGTTTMVVVLRSITAQRVLRTQNEQIVQLLEAAIAELSAGASVINSLKTASEQVDEAHVHADIAVALSHAAIGGAGSWYLCTSKNRHLQQLGCMWDIAEQHGISMTKILRHLHEQINHKMRHDARMRASIQGATVSAIILAALPLLGIGMGYALGVDAPGFLFGGGVGGAILILGMGCECAGVLWSRRIIERATT